MNCAYHLQNGAVVNCNGCGKPLCPACDHRIKGFPFCQDCIVTGVQLLRNRTSSASFVPFVKRQSSPFAATLLSLVCPGLGAAYNGQTSKALIYFAVFAALFQLAAITGGMPLFVFGFIAMWLFSAVDAWRTAQAIRSGVAPDVAEDIIVKRFSGNPKLWGAVLVVLGSLFFLQTFAGLRLFRAVFPVLLIAFGIWLLRDFIFKEKREKIWNAQASKNMSVSSENYSGETIFRTGDVNVREDFAGQQPETFWKTKR